MPVDVQQGTVTEPLPTLPGDAPSGRAFLLVPDGRIGELAGRIRGARGVAILLGGPGLSRAAQQAAGRIAAEAGASVYSEAFPARAERGGGLPAIGRLPYFPEQAVRTLAECDLVLLAGAAEPGPRGRRRGGADRRQPGLQRAADRVARHGMARDGTASRALTSLTGPCLGWVSLASGLGVPATRATTTFDLSAQVGAAFNAPGPFLIEMVL